MFCGNTLLLSTLVFCFDIIFVSSLPSSSSSFSFDDDLHSDILPTTASTQITSASSEFINSKIVKLDVDIRSITNHILILPSSLLGNVSSISPTSHAEFTTTKTMRNPLSENVITSTIIPEDPFSSYAVRRTSKRYDIDVTSYTIIDQSNAATSIRTRDPSSQHDEVTSPLDLGDQSKLASQTMTDKPPVNNNDIERSQSFNKITVETHTEGGAGMGIVNGEGVTPPPSVQLNNVRFMKELDELDEYMVNISKYESACARIPSLSYCENIDYPVPKSLAAAPYFQDNMAKAAVETLSILTEGGTTQCEQQIKKVFCHQKFPRCDDYRLQLQWHVNDTRNCLDALSTCSSKAKDTLNKMKICQKLSRGSIDVNQCIIPILPGKQDLCSHGNVSAWLYHSNVEINSLLRFQFSLNEKLSSQCKSSLTSHMCSFGLQCFSEMSVYTKNYLENVKRSCDSTVKACENQELSGALTQMFLDCKRFV